MQRYQSGMVMMFYRSHVVKQARVCFGGFYFVILQSINGALFIQAGKSV